MIILHPEKHFLVFDTETTGLNPYKGARPFAYIYRRPDTEEIVYDTTAFDINMWLMAGHLPKVGHNLKFDIQIVEHCDHMQVNGQLHDTMIMAHIFNPGEQNKKLKFLAKKYCGIENTAEQAIKEYMRKNDIPNQYDKVPVELMRPYATDDVRMTWELFNFYREKGVMTDPVYQMEMRLLRVLIEMERRGVLVDTDYLTDQKVACELRMEALLKKVSEEYGDLNIFSNKQLATFLFEEEGLTCDSYSEAGNPVLDEYMLPKYDHGIVPQVLEARDLNKVYKTYVCGIINAADDAGVVHCNYQQLGAKTGRLSCREPNLQNLPKHSEVDIRQAFICRPEYEMYYLDYSQIELRILAHYSKDDTMIQILKEGGDLHGATAKGIFGADYTKDQRDISKRINFGIVYGIGPKHFTEVLNTEYPEKGYTYSDARRYIDGYYSTYRMVRPFINAVQRRIMERGYVEDIFKRKYPCPKDMAYRAVNYLIQGCAAGVMKNAMITVADFLKDKQSNLLMTIHDELIIEVHKSELDIVPTLIKFMEDRDRFRVPITVGVQRTCGSWKDKTEINVAELQPATS